MDIKQFNQEGFYISKGLLPKQDTESLLDDIYQLFHLQLKRLQPEIKYNPTLGLYDEMQQLLGLDVDAYLSAARRCAKLVKLHHYLSHKKILNEIDILNIKLPTIVTEPIVHISADKLTIPGGYAGFETHQDWPSIQGSLDCIVVWTPLVKVSKINFPLQVIPKSHKEGLLSGHKTSNLYKIDTNLFDANNFVSLEADIGDVIFMTSWTLHRTGIENSKGFRIACSTRYDNCLEPTFIERGFPCAYKRTVDRDLIAENFPSKETVRNIYK